MLSEKEIVKLELAGFKRWQNGQYDRLYVAPMLVAQTSDDVMFGMSNGYRGRIKASKCYVDVKTGKAVLQWGGRDAADEDFEKAFHDFVADALDVSDDKAQKAIDHAEEIKQVELGLCRNADKVIAFYKSKGKTPEQLAAIKKGQNDYINYLCSKSVTWWLEREGFNHKALWSEYRKLQIMRGE